MGADPKLVSAAIAKKREGKKLRRDEERALRALQKDTEERDRKLYYATIPKKHWEQLSGRHTRQLNEQALRYQIPVGGATIDLAAVARWIHDLLAAKGHRLGDEDDPVLSGPASPKLEELRAEMVLIKRMERLRLQGEMVARADVHSALAELAAPLRDAIEKIASKYGNDAAEIIGAAVQQIVRVAARFDGQDAERNGHDLDR